MITQDNPVHNTDTNQQKTRVKGNTNNENHGSGKGM